MKQRTGLLAFTLGVVTLGLLAFSAPAQETKPAHSAVTPSQKDLKRHEAFVAIAKRGGVDVLFLGDSITDAWGGEGHNPKSPGAKLFEKEFLPLKAANFGIGGDRTQHVLWRLQHGELTGIQPKVVMLMIGTNNSNGKDNSAEEIADGITAIVKEIHKQSPKTKVLLLGIFPRANRETRMPNKAQMDKIHKVNAIVAKLDDGGKTVRYLDIGKKFLGDDGLIPKDIMPDQLHLSPKGYQIWTDAVKGPIMELMGKK